MKRLEDVLHSTLPDADGLSAARTGVSSSGVSESAGEPERICPLCRGAGFVYREVPLGHPEFGRAMPCSCAQQETTSERLARLQRYSNLGALSRYTFSRMTPQGREGSTVRDRYERAVRLAAEFAAEPDGWLVLLGESGSGKTHIAAAIANEAIAAGRPALFLTVPDLLDHLRAAFAPDAEQAYDRLLEQLRDAPLLVIDDLGVQSPTPWAEEKVYQIINHRFNRLLPTVFTVAGRVESLDDRLRSRLSDGSLAKTLLLEGERLAADGQVDALALPLLSEMTFQTFHHRPTGPDLPDLVARKLQHAFTVARDFALNPEGWLVLAGETGCGKTHLAAAVAHQQRTAGRPYLFLTVPDLLDSLRSEIASERPRDAADSIDRIQNCPFLVLDDLGVHNDTAWAQEKLFQVLNHRYNAKLPTVITIRPSEELPAAVRSRLFDDKVSQFLEIDAPDYRNPERPRNVSARRGRPSR